MKVIILAGGYGTRLGNITGEIPKPMVRIGDKPILWHIMKIYSHYNLNDFIICLGYKQEIIKNYFHNYDVHASDFTIHLSTKKIEQHNMHDEARWKVSLIDTGLDSLKGDRVKQIEKYLDDDINLMTYGDGVIDVDINELIQFHKSHGKILTITGVRPPSRFGEITEKDGVVTSFKEKPQFSSGLINGGFFVFDKRLFKYLEETPTDIQFGDLEFGTFQKLADMGEIRVFKHHGNWECVDTERDLKHLNKLWANKESFWKKWK
ncbi:MAG: glucose-1-phosphate cytidylyltransferase [bacterium]|nr:glucose-1-phosphate cytidylyltransferase [bacterium]